MKTFICVLLALISITANAQIYIADTNSSYFQDFNTLDSFGTAAVNLPAGWYVQEFGTAANASYRAGTGSAATSDTYSFGSAQSRDRALGSLASGTLTRVMYGTMFINRSGSDIRSMSVTYKGEQWRRGGSGSADSLRFWFSTVRGVRADDSGAKRWTEVPALTFRSVSTLSAAGALNGNDSARVLHASLPLMLHPGDSVLVRWCDYNAAGSDDGLAIDSLSIHFSNGDVTQGNHPRLVAFSPDSTASGLLPALSMKLRFDRAVHPAAGYLRLVNLTTSEETLVRAADGQPQNSRREYVYGGLSLTPGTKYLVRFDSSSFDSLGFVSSGLYDSSWTFRIADAPAAVERPESRLPGLHAMTGGKLLLSLPGTIQGRFRLLITGMDGRKVLDREFAVSQPEQQIETGLPPGNCYVAQAAAGARLFRLLWCIP